MKNLKKKSETKWFKVAPTNKNLVSREYCIKLIINNLYFNHKSFYQMRKNSPNQKNPFKNINRRRKLGVKLPKTPRQSWRPRGGFSLCSSDNWNPSKFNRHDWSPLPASGNRSCSSDGSRLPSKPTVSTICT